ncbi:hypothetical protein F2Q69_00034893 [Brassica cretica]|uniref:Uncharacterized protein n=1 Tax=Brassica cretica TaxID=69181 RepID=A0A8S9SMF5_BRACR|nr:hypothetical protein F2Q69_00034893 [Brassica cretica]
MAIGAHSFSAVDPDDDERGRATTVARRRTETQKPEKQSHDGDIDATEEAWSRWGFSVVSADSGDSRDDLKTEERGAELRLGGVAVTVHIEKPRRR